MQARIHAVMWLAFLAAGCDALGTQGDTQARQSLQGNWYYEYRDPYERPMRAMVTFNPGGTFSTRERPRDEKACAQAGGRSIRCGLPRGSGQPPWLAEPFY